MRWDGLDNEKCPVARTLAVVGDRWTVLVLRDALRGVTRFDAFQQRLGCSRAILSERLSSLVEHGVLSRELYEEHPPRHEYRLTEKGRALAPILWTMASWGETWEPRPHGYRVNRRHKGHSFQPVITCSECGEPVSADHVEHVDPMQAREKA